MSGLEALGALVAATRDLAFGSVFDVNVIDACDLAKLTPELLVSVGFSERNAERVSSSLCRCEILELGRCLGLSLRTRRWARLLSPG